MGTIAKVTAGGATHLIASTCYGTCGTAAGTAAKVATIQDSQAFTLITGVTVHIKFTYSNTNASPTLNVNSTGAKSIKKYGTTTTGTTETQSWYAGSIVSFTYDGTNWVQNDYKYDTDTTYTGDGLISVNASTHVISTTATANTGTVTKVSTGAGLTGGDIQTSGTIKCDLKSETKSTLAAAAKGSTASREYAVGLDKNGDLSVNIPWTDTSGNDKVAKAGDTMTGGIDNTSSTGPSWILQRNSAAIKKSVKPSSGAGAVVSLKTKTASWEISTLNSNDVLYFNNALDSNYSPTANPNSPVNKTRRYTLQPAADASDNNEYKIGYMSTPTDGQVMIADGTDGKVKSSGYTIAKSVPSTAVFTDRYVNSATFADDTSASANSPVKMTLTRAGSDTSTVTANLPKISSSSAGVVPKGAAVSSQSQTTKFLREDGAWAAPTYTTNTDKKVEQKADPATNANFRLLMSKSGNNTLEIDYVNKAEALYYNPSKITVYMNPTHTATSTKNFILEMGNNKANGAEGSNCGVLRLYGKGAYYGQIWDQNSKLTKSQNYQIPNATGTLALTEHFSANNIFDYRQAVPRTNKDVAAGDFTAQGYIQFIGTANGAGANLNQYSMTIPNAKAGDKVTLSYTVISGSFSHTNSSDTTIYILDKNGSGIAGSRMSFPASLSQGDTASKTYTLQDSDIDNINNGNLSGASFKGVQVYMRQNDVFNNLVLAIRVHYEDCSFNNEYKSFTKTNSQLTESTKWKTNSSCRITSSTAGVVEKASAYDEILIKGEIASSSISGLFVMIHIPIIALTTTNQAFRGGWYQNATGNYGGAIYFNARKNGDTIEVSLYLAYLNGEPVTSTSSGTIYYR